MNYGIVNRLCGMITLTKKKIKNFHIEDGDEESYENEVVDEEIFRLFLLVTSPQLYYGFRTVNGCLKNSLEVKGRKRKN